MWSEVLLKCREVLCLKSRSHQHQQTAINRSQNPLFWAFIAHCKAMVTQLVRSGKSARKAPPPFLVTSCDNNCYVTTCVGILRLFTCLGTRGAWVLSLMSLMLFTADSVLVSGWVSSMALWHELSAYNKWLLTSTDIVGTKYGESSKV